MILLLFLVSGCGKPLSNGGNGGNGNTQTQGTLTVAGPTSTTPGLCAGPFTATVTNASGVATPLQANSTLPSLYLGFTQGVSNAGVYSDSKCGISLTAITIPAGKNATTFYVKAIYDDSSFNKALSTPYLPGFSHTSEKLVSGSSTVLLNSRFSFTYK